MKIYERLLYVGIGVLLGRVIYNLWVGEPFLRLYGETGNIIALLGLALFACFIAYRYRKPQ